LDALDALDAFAALDEIRAIRDHRGGCRAGDTDSTTVLNH
jgi:hypothetical protein